MRLLQPKEELNSDYWGIIIEARANSECPLPFEGDGGLQWGIDVFCDVSRERPENVEVRCVEGSPSLLYPA